jgi:hypothetical protein
VVAHYDREPWAEVPSQQLQTLARQLEMWPLAAETGRSVVRRNSDCQTAASQIRCSLSNLASAHAKHVVPEESDEQSDAAGQGASRAPQMAARAANKTASRLHTSIYCTTPARRIAKRVRHPPEYAR